MTRKKNADFVKYVKFSFLVFVWKIGTTCVYFSRNHRKAFLCFSCLLDQGLTLWKFRDRTHLIDFCCAIESIMAIENMFHFLITSYLSEDLCFIIVVVINTFRQSWKEFVISNLLLLFVIIVAVAIVMNNFRQNWKGFVISVCLRAKTFGMLWNLYILFKFTTAYLLLKIANTSLIVKVQGHAKEFIHTIALKDVFHFAFV